MAFSIDSAAIRKSLHKHNAPKRFQTLRGKTAVWDAALKRRVFQIIEKETQRRFGRFCFS